MPFNTDDRRLIELAPGLGPTAVARLEEVGVDSLHGLKRVGVHRAIAWICKRTGGKEWQNRRRALQRVVDAVAIPADPFERTPEIERLIHVVHADVDAALRLQVASALSKFSISSSGVDTAAELMHELERADDDISVDLVIVDDGLPDARGSSLCKHIRRRHSLPIIVTTDVEDSSQRLQALAWGADDAVSKPLDPLELGARVVAIMRRSGAGDGEGRISLGPWKLDTELRCIVDSSGKSWPLMGNEYWLLRTLVKRAGRIVSRSELSIAMRGLESPPLDRFVDNVVCKLRSRLEALKHQDRSTGIAIRTVRGEGYRIEIPAPSHSRSSE